MLPPLSGPALPTKPTSGPTDSTVGTQISARTSVAPESGPARLKPETLEAIDPSRQSEASVRVSSNGTGDTDTRPAGPPPAFVETLLQRQARVALDPPEPSDPDETIPPSPAPRAEAGFAETRALATARTAPEIDRRE